ncbi:hypothetical protein ONE63_004697 [Megalurothrips usitatus]|uniref:Uncharacterized protein n=1 Tax=Megalurothrips usitatus TaxID=439358 RepID=A0AAV7X792_9NEOP|nr:hypothetical protein ONE63_004697 [Megalurothrips usitatus]
MQQGRMSAYVRAVRSAESKAEQVLGRFKCVHCSQRVLLDVNVCVATAKAAVSLAAACSAVLLGSVVVTVLVLAFATGLSVSALLQAHARCRPPRDCLVPVCLYSRASVLGWYYFVTVSVSLVVSASRRSFVCRGCSSKRTPPPPPANTDVVRGPR